MKSPPPPRLVPPIDLKLKLEIHITFSLAGWHTSFKGFVLIELGGGDRGGRVPLGGGCAL